MTIFQTKQLSIAMNHQLLAENISITFQSQEIWGIIGPNGTGKTTLLHTLAGLLPSAAGTIDIDQQPLLTIPPKHRAKKIGLLLQENDFPFPCTVLETALLGRYPYQKHWLRDSPVDRAIAEEALEKVQLESMAYRSVFHLSGGEKRRLAIATLLTQDPAIYLLDEPVNHLDMPRQTQLLNLFSDLARKRNRLIIMVLHNLHLAKMFCEKIILLGHNKEVIFGGAQDVLKPAVLNQLFPQELLEYCMG